MFSQCGFIAYYRISTSKQGRTGLGISAQRQAVANYLNGGNWKIIGGMACDEPETAESQPVHH